jgi:hypothetical protein
MSAEKIKRSLEPIAKDTTIIHNTKHFHMKLHEGMLHTGDNNLDITMVGTNQLTNHQLIDLFDELEREITLLRALVIQEGS